MESLEIEADESHSIPDLLRRAANALEARDYDEQDIMINAGREGPKVKLRAEWPE